MVHALLIRAMELTAWPDKPEVRALLCAYFLLVLALLSALNVIRLLGVGVNWERWTTISMARKLVVFTLLDSWLFCYCSAVLLFGVDAGLDQIACEVGVWLCIVLYGSSKVLIYLFLMERLYVVHSGIAYKSPTLRDRLSCWWYRVAAVFLIGWIGVAIAMSVGRNVVRHDDGTCKIGVKIWASVPMLTVDAIVNILLTAGFVIPLAKTSFVHAQALAKDSSIAAVLALLTSFANVLILSILNGHEMSYVCLGSCVSDVAANSCILFWVSRRSSGSESASGPRTSHNSGPQPREVARAKSTPYSDAADPMWDSGYSRGLETSRAEQAESESLHGERLPGTATVHILDLANRENRDLDIGKLTDWDLDAKGSQRRFDVAAENKV